MTHRVSIRVAQVIATGLLVACGGGGDSTAPIGPGTLEINVVTTGVDIDADGFALAIDNAAPVSVSANGTSSIAVGSGSHSLTVDGLAVNCDVTGAPATVSVASKATTRVDIRASCVAFLRNAVFLLDRFGKGRTKLVYRSNFDGSPAWSPDGTRIAFRSDYPGPTGADHSRIFIVNRDGTGLRQLTPETPSYTTDDGSSWSPDGSQIIFSQLNTLYLIKPDGTGLTSTGVGGHHPAWSPDGSQIAFDFNGIFVMDRSFNQRQLTTAADYIARWSPDGRQLVFARAQGGQNQLYRSTRTGRV